MTDEKEDSGPSGRKCLIVQPIHEDGLRILRAAGVTPVMADATDPATLARMVRGCEAVITRNAGFPADAFAGADRLKTVVVHGTGHDAVDAEAAARRGVLIANTPGINAQSVAEHALALTLALARGICAADAAEREARPGFRESRMFSELAGKSALIVGWGAVGSRFGQLLDAALGMQIMVHSPNAMDTAPYAHVDKLEMGLAQADLIALHTALRPGSPYLMNAQRFAAVKPGALLVNLGRAGLIDETALDRALASGRISGAGLDVYSDGAPLGPLSMHRNVIFTPHLGATTEEALSRVARAAAEHVLTVLSGGVPDTTLNHHVREARA